MRDDGKRRRRWIAFTALGVVVAIVAGLGALRMNASRLDAEVHARAAGVASRLAPGAPRREAARTRGHPPGRTSSPRRTAAAPQEAAPQEADSLEAPASPAQDPADAAPRLLDDPSRPGCEIWPLLYRARRDADAVVSPETRAWLDAHASDLDGLARLLEGDDGGSAARALLTADAPPGAFDPSTVLWDQHVSTRLANLHCILAADAVRWTDEGEPLTAEESLEVLFALAAAAGPAADEFWIGAPGLLRRVRPANARDWIARIDDVSPASALLDNLRRRALHPRRREQVRLGEPTLDVLHDDLPGPLRRALDAAVFTPMADARWARRSMQILDIHDDLAGTTDCLPRRRIEEAPADPDGDIDWRIQWARAMVREADLLVAREVLRLAHPEEGVEPRDPPCPDWSIEVETLPDGTRRVRAVGSVRDLSVAPHLEYELPP